MLVVACASNPNPKPWQKTCRALLALLTGHIPRLSSLTRDSRLGTTAVCLALHGLAVAATHE